MKLNRTLVKFLAIVALLTLPLTAVAQLNTSESQVSDAGFADDLFGCDAATGGILCILQSILNFILAIAFIVAVIFLVVGGFRYIVSQGNEESVEKAKGTITNAIIGIVVIILAFVILQVVFNIVNEGSGAVGT